MFQQSCETYRLLAKKHAPASKRTGSLAAQGIAAAKPAARPATPAPPARSRSAAAAKKRSTVLDDSDLDDAFELEVDRAPSPIPFDIADAFDAESDDERMGAADAGSTELFDDEVFDSGMRYVRCSDYRNLRIFVPCVPLASLLDFKPRIAAHADYITHASFQIWVTCFCQRLLS